MLIQPHDDGMSAGAMHGEASVQWRSFMTGQGFGHLGVSRDGLAPILVPTQFVLGEDEVVLHLAKPNPVFAAIDATPHAVLSVAGDWAYIPGAWKMIGDEDPTMGVPTTYYAAVQITGTIQVIDDAAGIAEILRTQIADVEPDSDLADPLVHEKRFKAIRGLRLSIDDVRVKFKFGGNVDDEHRQAIAQRLRDRNGPGDRGAANRVPGLNQSQ